MSQNINIPRYLNIMYKIYQVNPDNWINEYVTSLSYHLYGIKNDENPDYRERHYQLLRYIIYEICENRDNEDYLNFLGGRGLSILMTVLEENAISAQYDVSYEKDTRLYNILDNENFVNAHTNRHIFKPEGKVQMSNTQVKMLVEKVLDDPSICDKIDLIKARGLRRSRRRSRRIRRKNKKNKNKSKRSGGKKRKRTRTQIGCSKY